MIINCPSCGEALRYGTGGEAYCRTCRYVSFQVALPSAVAGRLVLTATGRNLDEIFKRQLGESDHNYRQPMIDTACAAREVSKASAPIAIGDKVRTTREIPVYWGPNAHTIGPGCTGRVTRKQLNENTGVREMLAVQFDDGGIEVVVEAGNLEGIAED